MPEPELVEHIWILASRDGLSLVCGVVKCPHLPELWVCGFCGEIVAERLDSHMSPRIRWVDFCLCCKAEIKGEHFFAPALPSNFRGTVL